MKTQLKQLGIDTHNKYTAVESAGLLNFDADTYRRIIGELTNSEEVNIGDDEADHTFRYIVQDIFENKEVDLDSAQQRAIRFITKHPHVLIKPDRTSYYVPKKTVDATGAPVQKKGAKKQKALKLWRDNEFGSRKDWIEFLMKEVPLSKAAASTYYHNMKTGTWK